jgi:MoaE-MoaD fusion protein
MKILVKLFAIIKDKTGKSTIEYQFDRNITIRELKEILAGEYPNLKLIMPNMVTAINQNFALDEDMIPDGAEVAIFPPVSGGNGRKTIVKITRDEIRVDEVVSRITTQTIGAVCTFTGIVRGLTDSEKFKNTSWLEYEAYQEMAEAKLNQIAEDIYSKWPKVESVVLIQRIGKILPGQTSVIVVCSGAHRDSGVFEGAEYGINRIKEIVPVWKKEVNSNEESWIGGKYHPGKGE